MKSYFRLYPKIQTEQERDVALLTLSWAFHPFLEQVEIQIDMAEHLSHRLSIPDFFDPKTIDYFARAPFQMGAPPLAPSQENALCFRSNVSVPHGLCSLATFDPNETFHHTWSLQRHLLKLSLLQTSAEGDNFEALRYLKQQQFKRAYLFGSGPSLASLEQCQLDSGVRVICNGVALNRRATELIRPNIVAAIDPLYHCGVSFYSGRFIAEVRRLMDVYGTLLVTRKEFVPWYVDRLPEEKIVGLEFRENTPFHYHLERDTWLSNLNGNVLCAALLPLGAFLADEVCLLGFDGKDPHRSKSETGNRLFWRHDGESSISNWEALISQVNPRVFARDFDAYHLAHERQVTQILSQLAGEGKKCFRMSESFIPPIESLPRCPRNATSESVARLSSS